MQLAVEGAGPYCDLTRLWAVALQPCIVRHPTGAVVKLTLLDSAEPILRVELDETRDSRDPSRVMKRFIISNVRLTFFPGFDLARKWLSAAFGAYVLHEALELTTVGNLVDRPLDPHVETEPGVFGYDMALREGLPPVLTPETMRKTFSVVMYPSAVEQLMESMCP